MVETHQGWFTALIVSQTNHVSCKRLYWLPALASLCINWKPPTSSWYNVPEHVPPGRNGEPPACRAVSQALPEVLRRRACCFPQAFGP